MTARKHFKRIVHVPMLREKRNQIAMVMRMAVEAMLLEPTKDRANELAKLLAIMTASIDYMSNVPIAQRKDAAATSIVAALEAIQSVQARFDAKGVWGMSGDEVSTLRNAMARFDDILSKIPYNVYEAARYYVEDALKPSF